MIDNSMGYLEYGSGTNRVILHPLSSWWLVMNQTGGAILRALLQGATPEQVASDIRGKYGIAFDTAIKDVFQVLDTLIASKFLPSTALTLQERAPEPRSLFLHLTRRCNLSCLHCYAGDSSRGTPMDLPSGMVLGLLDKLKALGGRAVTLSGGEPLLHPEIKSIIAHAGPELEIRFLTNGTLMNRDWADFLADHGAKVQVSIDGSRPAVHDAIRGPGSFEKAIRGIAMLQEAGLSEQINLAATVMRQSLHDLPEIMGLAERLGVPLVRFLPLRKRGTAVRCWEEIGAGLGREDAERFYDYAIHRGQDGATRPEVSCGLSGFMLAMPEETDDDIWCPVGRQLVVDVDGSVYPCAAMMTPDFRMGSVYEQGLEELFHSVPMSDICAALTKRRLVIERCASCPWRNLCQSGCMALALEHKGTIWDTDDFCDYRQKLYEEAFDRILALEDEG